MMSKHDDDLMRVGLIKLGEKGRKEEREMDGSGIFGGKNVKTQFV